MLGALELRRRAKAAASKRKSFCRRRRNGVPVAVIETVDVFVVPFNEVPSGSPTTKEKEIDRWRYWSEAHRNYFSRQRFKDRVFDERMPLVCERFRVVYVF